MYFKHPKHANWHKWVDECVDASPDGGSKKTPARPRPRGRNWGPNAHCKHHSNPLTVVAADDQNRRCQKARHAKYAE